MDDKALNTILQEYKILAEYKMIELEKIDGVYVIPSNENSLLWYGVIFVREGYYVDAVFRFTISLPDKFPDEEKLPNVAFQNDIFHPLICPNRGTLCILNTFSSWRSGEDHIWQLLKYIQSIFLDPRECLRSDYFANNEDAKYLLENDQTEFISRVRNCVAVSRERIYDPSPTNDSHYICFEKFDNNVHGPILEKMALGKWSPEETVAVLTRGGLSWVKEDEVTPLST